ncbi:hypothetical protein BDM02DRAFT_3116483 [Thelephora ganbajun]|uniref:Uncharacterized protein n=1 Tax=Thelephora ganbajun TaxID=370292 RepID=A0ACB6ZEC4_THEGA|nr:hypothetical protein BDM02DRAFT_3116483 [Thelephora ganbajun]
MPLSNLLRQLLHLDQSSPESSNHLTSLLHEQRYEDCTTNLKDGESALLIEYLDTVRLRVALTNSPPKPA